VLTVPGFGMICQIVPGFVTLRNMRWLAILAFFLVLTGSALAAGSDEQYLDIYNEILQGDGLMQSGHSEDAALRYLQAQTDLQISKRNIRPGIPIS